MLLRALKVLGNKLIFFEIMYQPLSNSGPRPHSGGSAEERVLLPVIEHKIVTLWQHIETSTRHENFCYCIVLYRTIVNLSDKHVLKSVPERIRTDPFILAFLVSYYKIENTKYSLGIFSPFDNHK
jgi:hypothetical protein